MNIWVEGRRDGKGWGMGKYAVKCIVDFMKLENWMDVNEERISWCGCSIVPLGAFRKQFAWLF
jgi:hypothetical protein